MAMIRKPRLKVVLLLSLLVLVSAGMGFFAGIVLTTAINKKKEKPEFWQEAAMKQLEKLHPDAAQKQKFEARTRTTVKELNDIRQQSIKDVWEVVKRAVGDIDKELTPEQRKTFDKIKPKAPPEAKIEAKSEAK